jgi:ABC-type branched-subunit amino acid transport system substrate-binding protein
LLVNAFLEDLRREYRLRPWQIWRKRRMTYLVLLLDDITADNGGFEILRLLNEVRNQVGLFDPLLVISAGAAVPPPDAGQNEPGRPRHQAINAGLAYRTWQNELRNARRARGVTAWYLPIAIPDSGSDGELEQAEAEFGSFDGYATSRRQASPHWWSSRVVRIGAVALLLVLAIGGPTAAVVQLRDSHCGTGDSMLTSIGDECIGMSDGSYDLFQPSNDSIHQVVQKIYLQNQQAEQLHLDVPARPYLTLVGMHALTSSNGTAEGLTAEREEMEGMAIAQLRQLRARGLSDPIVRILIANAGQEMHAGVQVAAQLRDLADRDRSIVAVVGLDMSSTATEKTISALSNAGLPTVASTLSADGLADLNPMYFQVAPQNRREAEIAAAFVDRLSGQPRAVRVYYSDDSSDSYSTNLRDDAFTSFHTRKFAIQTRAFTPNLPATGPPSHEKYGDPLIGNAAAAGRDTCSYRGYVFFVGRGVPDFGDFMSGAAQCGSQAVFVGGDDVTRFVADQVARQQNRALPYYYLSFATAPVAQPAGPARDFYSSLAQEFTFEQGAQGRSLDGHAALSYDAAEVVITAAAYLRETAATIPVTPGSIWREITAIHTSQVGPKQTNKQLEGVTGTIDFGGDLGRNVPQSKPVAVLRVENGEVDPTIRGFCGHAADRSPAPWCPAIG